MSRRAACSTSSAGELLMCRFLRAAESLWQECEIQSSQQHNGGRPTAGGRGHLVRIFAIDVGRLSLR